jgi:peroxiredoxin
MYKSLTSLIALCLLSLVGFAQPSKISLGQIAPNFSLKDINGKQHSLQAYRGKFVVVGFVADEYKSRDVVMLGINSNANEPFKIIKPHIQKNKIGFPVLKDEKNIIANEYGAFVTPEVYVIDKEGTLRYHGRVDNTSNESRVERHDLRVALDEMLSGKAVSKPELKAFGCQINRSTEMVAVAIPVKASVVDDSVTLLKPAEFKKLKEDAKDKVLVINFWATWCAPCVAEFPEFVKLDAEYRSKGVKIIAISTDEKSDLKDAVIPFLKKQKAEFPSYLSDAEDPQELIDVVDKNWSGALPATFVFDKTGKMILAKYGIIDREELVKKIEEGLR